MARPAPSDLESWSARHWSTAQALSATGDPWAAVAAFYSIYPLLRSALIQDKVFLDMKQLKHISPYLTQDDKFVTKHDAGINRKTSFGLNQLCTALYPQVTNLYQFCHKASIQIRYEEGFRKPYSLTSSMQKAEEFLGEYAAGHLVYDISNSLGAGS